MIDIIVYWLISGFLGFCTGYTIGTAANEKTPLLIFSSVYLLIVTMSWITFGQNIMGIV